MNRNMKTSISNLNNASRSAVVCFAIGCLAIQAFANQADAAAPQNSRSVTKPTQKSKVEWTQGKTEEIKIGRGGLIQTYRLHRSNHQEKKGDTIIQSRIEIEADDDTPIHVGQPLHVPGMNAIQIFSNELPHQHGVFGGQIVVELKKVNVNKKARSVGFFAPNSWIESRDGTVELFAHQVNLATPSKTSYWIGVRCREQSQSQNELTLVVDDVVEGSAADMAGIEVRDRITRWNRKPLNTVESLVSTIQTNKDKPAKLEVIRDSAPIELTITPDARVVAGSQVQTVIVPAAQANVAEKKIAQLKKLVEVSNLKDNRQFRVLLVGPGVNFGNKEIELQIDPEIHATKAHLKQMLDRVAEKKFGIFVEEDTVTLKKAVDEKGNENKFEFRYDLGFEPDEIWETIHFGVEDKKFSFEQLAPRVISRVAGDKLLTVRKEVKEAQNLAKRLKGGQIVFPNPLSAVHQAELKAKIDLLKKENERIRAINADLKAALEKLKTDLQKNAPDNDR